ncbi:DUF4412 domain-containing protein [Parapedobacter soli]|uniref:DUF4412 domain-containing protein n=1 Tax=Parapedobacter soli TaxID=416955 RepID=UPI0021C89B4B|nr:DUF4412 domain-containing protein [Parapedobacter soli]
MNYKAIVLMAALAVGSMGAANGQFLKKLGEKAEKAAERTVERRVERETEKKTDKALDKVFEGGEKGSKEKASTDEKGTTAENDAAAKRQSALAALLGGGSMEDVPNAYTFSYRATMTIIDESQQAETNVLYWLEPDAAYFGTEVQAGEGSGQLAVMDMDLKSMIMFMDDGEQKTAMRLSGDKKLIDQYMKKATDEDAADVKITPIESKTILGYRCKGFQMETEDGVSKVWVTDETPVGLMGGALKGDYIPEGLPNLGPKALFMEMEYTPKNRKKGNVRMICTELKEVSMAINKKDYQSMAL